MLLESFKCILIRGKRGRGVSVLFTNDVQIDIDLLIYVRCNYTISAKNRYLFARPRRETPPSGYKLLEKFAKSTGAKNAWW